MKKLINFFFQGLLFVVPAFVSFYVVIEGVIWLDNLLPVKFPVSIPGSNEFTIPGLGILIIIIAITAVGYLGTKFVSNPFFILFEGLVERTPLLKIIYSSVKDLIEAFVGEKKRFSEPVLVTVRHEPLVQRIGFVTGNDLSAVGLDNTRVAVYLPYSYGFSGELLIVESKNITRINTSGTEMMKFVISGGVTEIESVKE